MKLPENKLSRFAILFGTECLAFFIICTNMRAVSQGLYFWTAITDMWLVAQSMIITKLMFDDEKARDWFSIVAYSTGGACGSIISIWMTKHVFGA